MMHLQQWWLVSYGDAYEQQWVFESEADARAFLAAVHGKMDPVPVTHALSDARIEALAARVRRLEAATAGAPDNRTASEAARRLCDHPLLARTVLSPLPNYIYSCGRCYSIVYGQ